MVRFQRILVHVDTRSESRAVFQRAVALAQQHQAILKVVDIVPEISWPARMTSADSSQAEQQMREAKSQSVDALAASAREQGVEALGKVLRGKASVSIMAEVVEDRHDLVMKDAKGAGSQRTGFFGTTATRLMRFCPCTVWAYREKQSAGEEKIVAAVDATAADAPHAKLNHKILATATALSTNGQPHVVHAWSVYGERLIKDYMKRDEFEAMVQETEQEAREKTAALVQPFGIDANGPQVHLLRGSGGEEIAKFANEQQYDVVVMGTVGRSGLSGLFVGNTAELLLNQVESSIVAVKPDDFVSPVKS